MREKTFKSRHISFAIKCKDVHPRDGTEPMLVKMMRWPSFTVKRAADVETPLPVPKGINAVLCGYFPSIPMFEVASLCGSAVSLASRYMPLFVIIKSL
jgi:hypothetical protein